MKKIARAKTLPERHVLFITTTFPRWTGDSTAPFVLHLAQDLQDLGWSVHVLAPHADGAAKTEVLERVSVQRFQYWWPVSAQSVCYQGGALVNLRRRRSDLVKVPALVASELAAAFRCAGDGRFSLVHSHWLLPQGFVAGIAAKVCDLPHITTIHGSDVFALRGRLMTRFKQAALRLSDAITVNSSATRAAVRSIAQCDERLHLIPMGAAVPVAANQRHVSQLRLQYCRDSSPVLLFAGRIIEEKGVGDLLLAVADLVPYLPRISAIVVGDGPDKERFQVMARQLGLEERVNFTGWVAPDDVATFMRAADIFVGPSKKSLEGGVEAQGLVFVEAMLAGTPVIACNTGGVADVVRHEETGLLVPESAPHDIARAVRRLHNDQEFRARLVRNASAHARVGFTRQASAERFSSLYRTLLKGRNWGSY